MYTPINHLSNLDEVRKKLIETISKLTPDQVNYKPNEEQWSILEILENLVWTEYWTNFSLWRKSRVPMSHTLKSLENSKSDDSDTALPHQDIALNHSLTRPRWGGSAEYWLNMLLGCSRLSHQVARFNYDDNGQEAKNDKFYNSHPGLSLMTTYFQNQYDQVRYILDHRSFPKSSK